MLTHDCIDKCELYFAEYNNFVGNTAVGNQFISQATNIVYTTDRFRILQYGARDNKAIILVVPSIFNSPEILFLSKKNSLINQLKTIGSVYLIEWLEVINSTHSFDDYAIDVTIAVTFLNTNTKRRINLIGHCIGGNLAIAATVLKCNLIKTLTLLTTPWDFSHFSINYIIGQCLNLDYCIHQVTSVPKIYTKILFFLLDPELFKIKLNRYFDLVSAYDKELFLKVEHWLMSGHNIPIATYYQITNQMIATNSPLRLLWYIGDYVINPSLINVPVSIVAARNDKIVPMSSALAIHNELKHSTIFEVMGGHINYLISDNDFFDQYKSWFKESLNGI